MIKQVRQCQSFPSRPRPHSRFIPGISPPTYFPGYVFTPVYFKVRIYSSTFHSMLIHQYFPGYVSSLVFRHGLTYFFKLRLNSRIFQGASSPLRYAFTPVFSKLCKTNAIFKAKKCFTEHDKTPFWICGCNSVFQSLALIIKQNTATR